MENKNLLLTSGNISVGGDEQLARFAIPIKFVTAERKPVFDTSQYNSVIDSCLMVY